MAKINDGNVDRDLGKEVPVELMISEWAVVAGVLGMMGPDFTTITRKIAKQLREAQGF